MAKLGENDSENRLTIGNQYVRGSGFEIGAGAAPSHYEAITELTFIDKRDLSELETLFGGKVPYQVIDLETAQSRTKSSPADFVIAHHVLEHTPNPIHTLIEWFSLLRAGGRFFLSIPSDSSIWEAERIPTPIEHIVDDFLFERNGDDYESKGHVLSFIDQWTAVDPDSVWYAKDDVGQFVAVSLSELQRSEHDLHWHTYTAPVARMTIEAAFYFAGAAMEWLCVEEGAGSIYLVGAKGETVAKHEIATPAFLRAHREALQRVAARIG